MKPRANESELLRLAAKKYHYNPDTGVFTFKEGRKKGKPAGYWKAYKKKDHTNFYKDLLVKVDFKAYYIKAHRLAWFISSGDIPNVIDHIDHANSKDDALNKIKNLRNTDNRSNSLNKSTPNKSGYKGVTPNKDRWAATIRINSKSVHIGTFDTPEMAHAAYRQALSVFYIGGFDGVLHRFK